MENTTATEDKLAVANTIREQIGHRAMVMIGARDLLGDERSLRFRVGTNAKRVTHVRVTLDPSDTYHVEFIRVGRAPLYTVTTLASDEGVYAEQLRRSIESNTGMYTSL